MSTITKPWLKQKIADMEEHRDLFPGDLDDDHGSVLAALRIAQASLEEEKSADPVAFINGAWTLVYYRPPKELGLKIGDKLYSAPPATASAPEPIKRNDADGWWMYKGRRVGGGCAEWYNRALDDCRASMLPGADGNSPVVPDGWVACSERMPDKLIPVMVMYADGEMWSSIWTGTKWDDGTDFPDPHAVTHWQDMPAAPQQEVKNGLNSQ